MVETKMAMFSMVPLERHHLVTVSQWLLDLDDLSLYDRSIRVPMSDDALRNAWLGPDEGSSQDRYWFSVTSEDDRLVAVVGLEKVSFINRDAVVPMFVEKAFRRRGIGVRCLSLVMDVAFRQLGLQRLTSYLREDNDASRSLTERVGFQREGCMRQAWFSGGQHLDMLVVGVLRQEWMERRKVLAEELDPRTIVMFGGDTSGRWSWPPVKQQGKLRDAKARRRGIGRSLRVKSPRA